MPPHPTETPATAHTVWRDADATLGTAGWLLCGATAVLTGVVAGFTVSHSLVLGRYFDWLVAGDDPAAFAAADPRSYARFRAERHGHGVRRGGGRRARRRVPPPRA